MGDKTAKYVLLQYMLLVLQSSLRERGLKTNAFIIPST